VDSPASTAPTKEAHAAVGMSRAGPWGSFESRTGTTPAKPSATSTLSPPSPLPQVRWYRLTRPPRTDGGYICTPRTIHWSGFSSGLKPTFA
jgi:hypothetical protein